MSDFLIDPHSVLRLCGNIPEHACQVHADPVYLIIPLFLRQACDHHQCIKEEMRMHLRLECKHLRMDFIILQRDDLVQRVLQIIAHLLQGMGKELNLMDI